MSTCINNQFPLLHCIYTYEENIHTHANIREEIIEIKLCNAYMNFILADSSC